MAKTLTLLRYEQTRMGSRPMAKRIKAILKLAKPRDKRGVRRINGIVHFVKSYIPNCAEIVHPLTNLTKDDVPFHFGKEEEELFKRVKAKVIDSILLP